MSSDKSILQVLPIAAPLALPIVGPAVGLSGIASAVGGGSALGGLAAGSGGDGFFSRFSPSSALSLGLSAAAGLSTLAEGLAESREFEAQARASEIQSTQALLEGRRRGIEALEQSNRLEATRSVVDASRGIRPEGTPEVSQILDRDRARLNLQLTRLGGVSQALGQQSRAAAFRQQGRTARQQGVIGGLTQFGQGAISALER